jgi:glycosyltransferase involved in cell wall biosynthesis
MSPKNMILVMMPYYNSEETLRSAVNSLLRQSYKDYELLIINDGDVPTPKEILKIENPRLKFFDLKENHGRYFCDAVALEANPHEFYLPTDSDDISDFNRLFYLVQKQQRTNADMTYHYQKVIHRTGKIFKETYPLINYPLRNSMYHLVHWSALYKTEALKNVGGIHPDFRVGYDTLLVNLIKMSHKVSGVPRFLYTRKIRYNSLTATKETGFGSPHRREVTLKLNNLYGKCYRNPEKIRDIIKESINSDTLKEVKKEAKRLRKEVWGL